MIEVEGLTVYKAGQPVLKNISIRMEKATITGIVGANGVGKTTLLRVIAGLEDDFEGRVKVEGSVALVPQDDLLLPWKKLWENIALPLLFKGVARGDARRKAFDVGRRLGLGEHLDKYPKEASGGTRRKAAIARALITGADILLLDEPFTGLDVETVENLAGIIRELRGEGRTLLVVSHQLWELAAVSDRVIVLRGPPGRISGDIRFGGGEGIGSRVERLVKALRMR